MLIGRNSTVVSIVSIHADQSRQDWVADREEQHRSFNRINSCRSIPTFNFGGCYAHYIDEFQSYQFMQINPDITISDTLTTSMISFNRINSCRSIPTGSIWSKDGDELDQFQSYQFMQINPDKVGNHNLHPNVVSFNRINSCRSIPTYWRFHMAKATYMFQSYQFMQINPDCGMP